MNRSTDFGINRVLHPANALPQSAFKLDPCARLEATEARIRVEQLNLDSASFADLVHTSNGVPLAIQNQILGIVAQRGKMQNPRTGSGGVLIGEVIESGESFAGQAKVGDRIVSLVSLTATPLQLAEISPDWAGTGPVIPVTGTAVLTDGAIFSVLPPDIPEPIALAVLDVCGAPALTRRILRRPAIDGAMRSRILILGGGKSACLTAVAARADGADVTVVVPTESERSHLLELEIADRVVLADATDPLTTRQAIMTELGSDGLPDLTVVCVNVPGVEHTALVVTRVSGAVIYFSMATNFASVALGAEALGLDLDLIIGSGYVPGHAESALQLVRDHSNLRAFFEHLCLSPHQKRE